MKLGKLWQVKRPAAGPERSRVAIVAHLRAARSSFGLWRQAGKPAPRQAMLRLTDPAQRANGPGPNA